MIDTSFNTGVVVEYAVVNVERYWMYCPIDAIVVSELPVIVSQEGLPAFLLNDVLEARISKLSVPPATAVELNETTNIVVPATNVSLTSEA